MTRDQEKHRALLRQILALRPVSLQKWEPTLSNQMPQMYVERNFTPKDAIHPPKGVKTVQAPKMAVHGTSREEFLPKQIIPLNVLVRIITHPIYRRPM